MFYGNCCRNNQENEASQRRMEIYSKCFNNILTCGPDVELSLPTLKPKKENRETGEKFITVGLQSDLKARTPEVSLDEDCTADKVGDGASCCNAQRESKHLKRFVYSEEDCCYKSDDTSRFINYIFMIYIFC